MTQLTTRNIWDTPLTPHAIDDEFDGATLDPAWTLVRNDTKALLSLDSNPVDIYATHTGNPRGNLTLRDSWLTHVRSDDAGTQMLKAVTLPTNLFMYLRYKVLFPNVATAATGGNARVLLGLTAPTGDDSFDTNNRVDVYNDVRQNIHRQGAERIQGGVFAGAGDTWDVDAQYASSGILALHKIGNLYHGWVANEYGCWEHTGSASYTGTGLDRIWLQLGGTTDNQPGGYPFTCIDFIRGIETDEFPF